MLAAALAAGLTLSAGTNAAGPVAVFGGVAVVLLIVSLLARKHELITAPLVALGVAYATILVIDNPPLDSRAAVIGACLLAIAELAHLAIDARSAVSNETGGSARRIASLALIVLGALVAGGVLVTVVDLLRTGGLAIDVLGAAAAVGAVGLLVLAMRDVRSPRAGEGPGTGLAASEQPPTELQASS